MSFEGKLIGLVKIIKFSKNELFLLSWNLVLIFLFLGFWIIISTYQGSFFQVWSLGLTGKYIIVNVVFSVLAGGIQFLEAFRKSIGKSLVLAIFLCLVSFDLIYVFFDVMAENSEYPQSSNYPFYFFVPFYFHLFSMFLLYKVWSFDQCGTRKV